MLTDLSSHSRQAQNQATMARYQLFSPWSGTGGLHPHGMDEGLSTNRDLSMVTSESRSESRSGPA